jgi:hypothetical protein
MQLNDQAIKTIAKQCLAAYEDIDIKIFWDSETDPIGIPLQIFLVRDRHYVYINFFNRDLNNGDHVFCNAFHDRIYTISKDPDLKGILQRRSPQQSLNPSYHKR